MNDRIYDPQHRCPKCDSKSDVSYRVMNDMVMRWGEGSEQFMDMAGDVRDYQCGNCNFWWLVADEDYFE